MKRWPRRPLPCRYQWGYLDRLLVGAQGTVHLGFILYYYVLYKLYVLYVNVTMNKFQIHCIIYFFVCARNSEILTPHIMPENKQCHAFPI